MNINNSQELLMNLMKKLESGEIGFDTNGHEYFLYAKGSRTSLQIGALQLETKCYGGYNNEKEWNKEFKENFYKEKGLDNCWYKDCQNKIFNGVNTAMINPIVDYKAVNIPCQDKHKRYICLECYEKKHNKEKQ